MTVSFSRRERDALGDTALGAGPDAPTLCEGWTVKDLVVHLLVRERPWLRVGAAKGLAEQPLEKLVGQLRTPPLLLAAVDPLDRAMNTVEMFVHHEDIRRAQPSWDPRSLAPEDETALLRGLGLVGRLLVLRAGVPVVAATGGRRLTLRRGTEPAVISGPVSEVTLFLFGRAATRGLAFDGPSARVETLRSANLGI